MTTPALEKHSITMPEATSSGVRARVGKRGFSAYVANAAARQLERDALDDLIAEMEAEHGPVDEREIDVLVARVSE